MKLIFVRHGKDDDRYRGGWSKLDLVPGGVEQVKQLAGYLNANAREYKIKSIVSSDLTRAMSTAAFISSELGLPIQEESRIREMNNGDLAGMENAVALERYPGLFFSSLEMDEPYPNGESPNDFYARIKEWFWEFADLNRDGEGSAVVITHGGVINIVYHLVKGLEWSNKAPVFKAGNCSLHILDLDTMEFEVENKSDY